jgi:hypothetical protein
MGKPSELPVNQSRGRSAAGGVASDYVRTVNGFIAFRPSPGMPRGGVLPPSPDLALGSALGLGPRKEPAWAADGLSLRLLETLA